MKKKKRAKSKNPEAKPHLSAGPKFVEEQEQRSNESAFGGMNTENFKKNLGCGS
jgi:hypothetical protein